MAVIIDVQAFHDSLPSTVHEVAAGLREAGGVGELERAGGGVQAVVRDGGGGAYQPWVGVVNRDLTAECECPSDQPWCAHAVVVALAAFGQEVRWSGAAVPPSADPPPDEFATYAAAVARLAPRQLAGLVVEQAGQDRLFATRLLRQAGMLTQPDPDALDWFDHVLQEAADVTSGHRWDIHDVESAGLRLAAEVAVLCEHPPTVDLLERVERALLVWDGLAGHLLDAYHLRRTDPEQVSRPLVDNHVRLCAELAIPAAELAQRLAELLDRCAHDTVDTDAYADLLGEHAAALPRPGYGW